MTLIAGPTASGKSALAMDLARRTGAVIVNGDSQQLYADLRILTARPSVEDEAEVPHRLYGVADAADAWSVGRWLRAATEVLNDLAREGRPAVVVGGTGLYFRALTRGIADIPPPSPEARREAEHLFDAEGEAATRAALAAVDPLAAARIAPGDRQRLVRALAVGRASGRALTDWWATPSTPPAAPDADRLVIEPDRAALYAACDLRVGRMIEAGVLNEVATLLQRELDPSSPLMKAVGVREFGDHLAGRITLTQALDAVRMATRRYAKRQLTWFRNQTPDWPRYPNNYKSVT